MAGSKDPQDRKGLEDQKAQAPGGKPEETGRSAGEGTEGGAGGTGPKGSGPDEKRAKSGAGGTGPSGSGATKQLPLQRPPSGTGAATGAGGTGPAGPGTSMGGDAAARLGQAATSKDGAPKDKGKEKAGRYAGAAASGAAEGAVAGGAPGAAAGAAKGVAVEAGVDAIGKAKEVTSPDEGLGTKDDPSKSGGDGGGGGEELGAGGTGPAGPGASGGSDGSGSGSSGMSTKKKVAAAGAAASAPPVAMMAMLIVFLNWLKSFFFMMLAKFMAMLQMIWQFLVNLVMTVVKFVTAPLVAAGSFVSGIASAAFGSGSALASTAVSTIAVGATGALGVTALLGSLISGANLQNTSRDDALSSSNGVVCTTNASNPVGGGDVKVDKSEEENAKKVYAVLSSWGMPDENIAGILGNWTQESRIDPTSVEGIFDEPYQIGPRKKAAEASGFSHMGYVAHAGIGFGQWTNARNTLLLNYAKKNGANWYDLGLQLKFMADENGDNPGDVKVIKDMIANSKGTPAEAATFFHSNWERSADGGAGVAARGAKAEMWYAKMSGWTVDDGVVEDLVGDFVSGAADVAASLPLSDACADNGDSGGSTGPISLKDGGLSVAEAQKVMDLYNKEGDSFLRGKYKGGGPGQCNGNYVENCVSFSTYWANKYTTFDQYAPGNGRDTASVMAKMNGKKTSSTPKPYSVFSHGAYGGYSSAGHTGVVLGIKGDTLIVGEAGYCNYKGRVKEYPAKLWKDRGWEFVDMSDMLKDGGEPSTDA